MNSSFSQIQQEAIDSAPVIKSGDLRQHPSVTDFAYRFIRTLDLDVGLVEILKRDSSWAPFPWDADGKIVHIDSFLALEPFHGDTQGLRSPSKAYH